jgi:glutamine synthetase
MDARSSGGAISFSDRLDSLGAKFVHLGLFDLDGTFRHKRVDRAKAEKLAAEGYPFCDILYRWDTAEIPYGGGAFIDRPARLFPETLRPWPFCEGEALCVADYAEPYGVRSPRNQLIGQIEKARSMGFSVHSAFEFEIMLLDEKPESLRDKGYTGLRHFAPGNRTYSMQTMVLNQELFAGLGAVMGKLAIEVDALHTELGPGTFEVPLVHAEGMRAADDAALFKNVAKAYFLRSGLIACFMSKLDETLSGQSGHLHISLQRLEDGSSAFADPSAAEGLSETARYFIGGLLRLMPECLSLCAHTVNAYKRLVPGAWAPTYASWGVQNRTVAVRAINTTPAATRLEFRVPSADTNPHSALAFCLAAGLWGIENRIQPPAPREDDCYATPAPPEARFPRDLDAAADRLDASEAARALFGDTFVDSFVLSRRMEAAAHHRAVGAWEIARYLEVS